MSSYVCFSLSTLVHPLCDILSQTLAINHVAEVEGGGRGQQWWQSNISTSLLMENVISVKHIWTLQLHCFTDGEEQFQLWENKVLASKSFYGNYARCLRITLMEIKVLSMSILVHTLTFLPCVGSWAASSRGGSLSCFRVSGIAAVAGPRFTWLRWWRSLPGSGSEDAGCTDWQSWVLPIHLPALGLAVAYLTLLTLCLKDY